MRTPKHTHTEQLKRLDPHTPESSYGEKVNKSFREQTVASSVACIEQTAKSRPRENRSSATRAGSTRARAKSRGAVDVVGHRAEEEKPRELRGAQEKYTKNGLDSRNPLDSCAHAQLRVRGGTKQTFSLKNSRKRSLCPFRGIKHLDISLHEERRPEMNYRPRRRVPKSDPARRGQTCMRTEAAGQVSNEPGHRGATDNDLASSRDV
ncbi:hypothetical protein BESB_060260 [Besnoitia besnoiti]|uniref:Uncharacterized protein n=1 Tax=Besnoitia besnoiti TaxID=94643 RepID=A0A2A9MB83_BESBE|nr:hypothetical protein BESB_060260 [Besnoitia besnoiti]PFH35139.1 hypothetical protein BESB_060260 [Besnoitia besnoiti]